MNSRSATMAAQLSVPGDAQTPPARGPHLYGGKVMQESTVNAVNEAALRLRAAADLLTSDGEHAEVTLRRVAAVDLIQEALTWLPEAG